MTAVLAPVGILELLSPNGHQNLLFDLYMTVIDLLTSTPHVTQSCPCIHVGPATGSCFSLWIGVPLLAYQILAFESNLEPSATEWTMTEESRNARHAL